MRVGEASHPGPQPAEAACPAQCDDTIEDFSSEDLEVDSAFSAPSTLLDASSSPMSGPAAPLAGPQVSWAEITAKVIAEYVVQVQAPSWTVWPPGALRPSDPSLVIDLEPDLPPGRLVQPGPAGRHKRRRGIPPWERLTAQAMAAYRQAHPEDDSFQRAMEERMALETRRSVSPTQPFTYVGTIRLEGGSMGRPPRRLGGGSGRSGSGAGSSFRTPLTYRGGSGLQPGLPPSQGLAGARGQAGGAASRRSIVGTSMCTPATFRGRALVATPAAAGGSGAALPGGRRRSTLAEEAAGAGLPRRRGGGSRRASVVGEDTDLDIEVADFEGQPPVAAMRSSVVRRRRTLRHQNGICGRQGDRLAWSCPQCPFATELLITAGEVAKARVNLSARRRGHLRRHHPEVADELRLGPRQLSVEVRSFRQPALMGWRCPLCSWGLVVEECEKYAEDVLWRAKRKHREERHPELTAAGWRSAIQKRAWTVPRRRLARAQLLNEYVARALPLLCDKVGSHETTMFFWMDFGFTMGERRQNRAWFCTKCKKASVHRGQLAQRRCGPWCYRDVWGRARALAKLRGDADILPASGSQDHVAMYSQAISLLAGVPEGIVLPEVHTPRRTRRAGLREALPRAGGPEAAGRGAPGHAREPMQ